MKKFLDANFLLESRSAEILYHEYAAKMPIIDYHNHLPPAAIANDRKFENITQAWLEGDHYKWRAMRANGIPEEFITGKAGDYEKFERWAETVPMTARNPLFHWTHMELQNPFGVEELLNPKTARKIYDIVSGKLASAFSVRALLGHFNVTTLCTTDDPADDLEFHRQLRSEKFSTNVLPTFRPDKAMAVENAIEYNKYLNVLQKATGMDIGTWLQFLEAMNKRHDYFAEAGCKISDHGLETFYAAEYNDAQVSKIFSKIRSGKDLDAAEAIVIKSACMNEFARMDASKGWVQQFHVGAIRNNNTRLWKKLGADSGADSIGDFSLAPAMSWFFDKLDQEGKLAKTIVYNLNPADNHMVATMVNNFNDGITPGKMQYGSAWWFLDQKDGMEEQLRVLSNMGLLSRFVGMLTDSRSFLSFPRHTYFRRILCNLIGRDVERGELPNDMDWLGKMVEDICYNNAKRYFQFD